MTVTVARNRQDRFLAHLVGRIFTKVQTVSYPWGDQNVFEVVEGPRP